MSLDHVRAVDNIINNFLSAGVIDAETDQTIMRQRLGHIVKGIFDELTQNGVITIDISGITTTITVDSQDYTGDLSDDTATGDIS